MARRRGKSPPPKPFADAPKGIDTLEQRVWNRTNDARFSGMDLVNWLLPADVVDRLQAAFPVIRELDRTQHWNLETTLPLEFPAQTCTFQIKVNSPTIHMLVPSRGLGSRKPDDPNDRPIMETLRAAHLVHTQFNKVRKVVDWLNDFATIGAARHYCPWLTSILPPDHPFQEATGLSYREPKMSMIGIVGTMRECGAIMASALLCGEAEDKTNGLVQVTFGQSNYFSIL